MSILKKLFGGTKPSTETPKTVEHNGFTIAATPYQEAGQYQTAGVITKEVDGKRLEHKFIRADRFVSKDEAVEFSLSKARQIIDQMGDRLFNQGNS
jgi:hypothetical protein